MPDSRAPDPIVFKIGLMSFVMQPDDENCWHADRVEGADVWLAVAMELHPDGSFYASTSWGELESGARGSTPEYAMRTALAELAKNIRDQRVILADVARGIRTSLEQVAPVIPIRDTRSKS